MIFFKETFRKERSSTYQALVKQRVKAQAKQFARDRAGRKEYTPQVLTDLPPVNLTLRDFNPARPLWLCIRRVNNIVILVASGSSLSSNCHHFIYLHIALLFGYAFVIAYTTSRTLGAKYGYNPLKIGLVLLSFGIG
jgi:hypothetical protein